MEKQISSNPVVNLDRFIEYKIVVSDTEIELTGAIFYKNALGDRALIQVGANHNFSFSTKGSYVHMVTGIPVDAEDENAIPELIYLKNIPKSAFPQSTVYDIVISLGEAMVESLDNRGKFNF